MKKTILNISALVITIGALTFVSCKKTDVTAPVVTLVGDASVTVSLQGAFADLEATATDNKDGKLTPTKTGTIDFNNVGEYVLTYSATDAAGNVGKAERTVTVVNSISSTLLGVYGCTVNPGAFAYTQTVTASTTLNNSVVFSKFAGYTGNNTIYATFTGNAINIPNQASNGNVGNPAAPRSFAGSGTKNTVGFNLVYTETTNGTTINNTETLVKQ